MNAFFIAGVQRSGTTLLSVMLDKHPDILLERRSLAFRIVSCFKSIYDILPYNLQIDKIAFLRWLIENDDKGRLANLLDSQLLSESKSIQALIEQSITNKLQKEGKQLWGDKSPNIEYFLSDLLLMMPKAKVIHMVRDGRATTYSMSTRSSKHLLWSAQRWVDGNIFGTVNQDIIGEERYKIVHYEALLRNPEKEMRSVCDFLEIAFTPEMLILEDKEATDNENYVKQFFDQSKIDKWRQQLNKKQLRRIEEIQGPLLEQLGYELITPKANLKYRPLSVWRRIRYNQSGNFKQLFRSKHMGMVDRKNVEIAIPLKSRVYTFFKVLAQDLLSVPIFKTLFSRVYYREKYFQKDQKTKAHQAKSLIEK